jgi:hypothetical protein
MLNRFLYILFFILVLISEGPFQKALGQPLNPGSIPKKYKTLYSELDQKLQEIDRHLMKIWDGQKHSTVFSVELIITNSHRGEALLREDTFTAILLTLDRLQSLGLKGMMVGILYPVLNPSFPHSNDYMNSYKRLTRD